MLSPDSTWPAPAETPLRLPVGEVHVWRVWLKRPPEELAQLADKLTSDELTRVRRYRLEGARQQFIASRAALRDILGGYLGLPPQDVRFSHGAMGKPHLAVDGPPIHFNLSHSHELALIAVARHCEVGVDVERVRRFDNQLPLAERFFAPQEVRALQELAEHMMPEAFFHAWTRKEALVKASGQGLGFGVDRIEVTLLPGEPAKLIRLDGCEKAAAAWSLLHVEPAPGYVGALALPGEPACLRTWHWSGP